MDLSMRGMKEMREELNADLLRRIAYLTKGQLMGEILFYIFLLSSIVYLIVGKVYKSIVCIKAFRKKKSNLDTSSYFIGNRRISMEYLRMSGKGGINAGERRYGREACDIC